jgi:hypothetical protein
VKLKALTLVVLAITLLSVSVTSSGVGATTASTSTAPQYITGKEMKRLVYKYAERGCKGAITVRPESPSHKAKGLGRLTGTWPNPDDLDIDVYAVLRLQLSKGTKRDAYACGGFAPVRLNGQPRWLKFSIRSGSYTSPRPSGTDGAVGQASVYIRKASNGRRGHSAARRNAPRRATSPAPSAAARKLKFMRSGGARENKIVRGWYKRGCEQTITASSPKADDERRVGRISRKLKNNRYVFHVTLHGKKLCGVLGYNGKRKSTVARFNKRGNWTPPLPVKNADGTVSNDAVPVARAYIEPK